MKLLSSLGPNPRGIRMYLLEKDITLPTEEIDILNAVNRTSDYAEKNPGAQMPALQLDDGTISELVASGDLELAKKQQSPFKQKVKTKGVTLAIQGHPMLRAPGQCAHRKYRPVWNYRVALLPGDTI